MKYCYTYNMYFLISVKNIDRISDYASSFSPIQIWKLTKYGT